MSTDQTHNTDGQEPGQVFTLHADRVVPGVVDSWCDEVAEDDDDLPDVIYDILGDLSAALMDAGSSVHHLTAVVTINPADHS